MSAFIADLKKTIAEPVAISTWVVFGLVVSLTGPFGSLEASPLWLRTIVCLFIVVSAGITGSSIRVMVCRRFPNIAFLPATALISLLSLLVMPLPIYGLLVFLSQQGLMNRPHFGVLSMLIGSMSLAISALRNIAARAKQAEIAAAKAEAVTQPAIMPMSFFEAPKPPEPRLLQRVDPDLRGDLYAISVRDHYVDVQTSAGNASLLLRLGDAMTEAEPTEGAQVHRSHWVAWDAVSGVESEAGKLFVRLHNGNRVPVSKNHREKLKERELM
jgi:hypothetical protein